MVSTKGSFFMHTYLLYESDSLPQKPQYSTSHYRLFEICKAVVLHETTLRNIWCLGSFLFCVKLVGEKTCKIPSKQSIKGRKNVPQVSRSLFFCETAHNAQVTGDQCMGACLVPVQAHMTLVFFSNYYHQNLFLKRNILCIPRINGGHS